MNCQNSQDIPAATWGTRSRVWESVLGRTITQVKGRASAPLGEARTLWSEFWTDSCLDATLAGHHHHKSSRTIRVEIEYICKKTSFSSYSVQD
ncbi:hypothetical protein M9435_000849 [Picochlorum sp. BPE23]|nr:hypothetical protein M9435_000849 [Picochlorum sp. BPE23]